MNEDLHRALDGDSDVGNMPHPVHAELDSWGRMLDAFRASAPSEPAPPWLEQRVMAEIQELPEPGIVSRLLGWLLRPTDLRVTPLAAGLVTAAGAFTALVPGRMSFKSSRNARRPLHRRLMTVPTGMSRIWATLA